MDRFGFGRRRTQRSEKGHPRAQENDGYKALISGGIDGSSARELVVPGREGTFFKNGSDDDVFSRHGLHGLFLISDR